ncbi:MAG: hypothetical protein IID45_02635 [Planctomycetes bacterium]|nr:hypothetical protein [Planctomycetota bacterium]
MTAFLCLQQPTYSQTGPYGTPSVVKSNLRYGTAPAGYVEDGSGAFRSRVRTVGLSLRSSWNNLKSRLSGGDNGAACVGKPCAGNGCAPQKGCAAKKDCCDPCCPAFWEHRNAVFGEFLYLTARGANVNFATPVDGFGANALPIAHIAVTDPDYDAGIRIGGTWAIDSCSSLEFVYTRWESNTEHSVSSAGGGGFIRSELTHPNTANVAADSLMARANYNIDFQLYDANYKALVWGGDCYFLNYVVGVRYAHLDQDLNAVYSINGATFVESEIDFNGFGPRIGLEGERLLSNGIFLYGKGFLNVLMGEFDVEYSQANVFAGQQVFTGFNDDRVVTILEFELGVGWQSECGKYRVSAGYYFASWFNTLTTANTVNAIQMNNFADVEKAITFDGLTARAEIRF